MSRLGISDLSVRLGDKRVLDNITAQFRTGEVTTIIGPNGAGKSTLLTCLAGLRKPDSGVVQFDGVDIASIPARARAQRLGYLPQIAEVAWGIDVRTLVGLGRIPFTSARGLAAEDQRAVDDALEQSNITAFAARNVTSLSGGERARALLARVLAGKPQWILADEPFAGLDPAHQLDTAALFRTLAREGRGVVVTLHDLHTALRMSDRVLVLGEGHILADGTPAEALAPEILTRAYGLETRFWDGATGPLIEIVGRRA